MFAIAVVFVGLFVVLYRCCLLVVIVVYVPVFCLYYIVLLVLDSCIYVLLGFTCIYVLYSCLRVCILPARRP